MSSANNARNLRIEIKRKVEDISDNIIDLTDVKQARKFEQTVIDLREVAEEVHNVRELSLVTHGLKDLSKAVKAQAGSLSKLASKLDFETLARGLKNQFEGQSASSLDWEKYGSHMFSIYDSTCKVTTLRGPLLLEVKARRERQPRASQDASDPAKATVVTQEEDGDDEATSERVYNLLHALDEVPKPDGATFDLLSLLVNPKNPVKTIENLFDFAFIVKEKRAAIKIDRSTGMPVAGPVLPDNLETRPKNQMVLSINIKDLRELSKEMGKNGTSKLLERDDELYETKDPHQQAQLLQRRRRRQKP